MTLKISQLARSARRAAAFTMIEIAISLGVIGFALVAIIGILPLGLNVQRDNRETTLINFDANFLMNAIRSGARGQDDLTNYIVSITNSYKEYTFAGGLVASGICWYTTSNYFASANTSFLTNGSNIIGLLSTPKYTPGPKGGTYYSNYVTADFRAISGSIVDQGASQATRDFAFTYRVYADIVPVSTYAFSNTAWMNYSANNGLLPDPNALNSTAVTAARDMQYNLTDVGLRFRWPVLPNGQVGLGHETFRSAVSGTNLVYQFNAQSIARLFFIQSQNFGFAQ